MCSTASNDGCLATSCIVFFVIVASNFDLFQSLCEQPCTWPICHGGDDKLTVESQPYILQLGEVSNVRYSPNRLNVTSITVMLYHHHQVFRHPSSRSSIYIHTFSRSSSPSVTFSSIFWNTSTLYLCTTLFAVFPFLLGFWSHCCTLI